MGQDPDIIRHEIEQTRDRMGDTVDALGYKADVPARTKDSITGRVDAVKSKLTGAGSQVAEATPDAGDLRHGARQAVGVVHRCVTADPPLTGVHRPPLRAGHAPSDRA